MKRSVTVRRMVRAVCLATVALEALGLALSACSTSPVDLAGGDPPENPSAANAYAGTWEGYLEAYRFRSGSDRVSLVLDVQANGSVRFGDGEPPPEPIDPGNLSSVERFELLRQGRPLEGFDYGISGAQVDGGRFRVRIDANQVFSTTCEIQSPVALPDMLYGSGGFGSAFAPRSTFFPDPYSCVPDFQISDVSPDGLCTLSTNDVVPCLKVTLCREYCECSATTCGARPSPDIALDLTLDATGTRLDGTLTGLSGFDGGNRATVRLTRMR
jgi:hypothetical protein